MMTYSMMIKSLLVVAIVVTGHGSAVEKLPTPCCTKVNRLEIKEEILNFEIQTKNGHCVNAVIFQTLTGRYCFKFNEPWVRRTVLALMGRTRATTRSLLKTITTRSSPPPPTFSATFPSSISEMPQTHHTGQ